jgi:uncharacterized membrane protein YsdA (DUF1294 family)
VETEEMRESLIDTLAIWIIAINLVAWAVYGLDKARARRGAWRVRETHLLSLALVGGSAGASLAMWMFRHKTSKISFRRWLYAIIAFQILAVSLIWRSL